MTTVVEQTKSELSTAATAVKEKAENLAEAQKLEGAKRIEQLGQAVQKAVNELGKELPEVSRYLQPVVDNLRNAGTSLREQNIGDLTERFDRFARGQPLAAFAGAVIAGFALARFLKSAPR